ncbi:MAG: adaptor protein MecA [Clostridia bacterium]|nr:adaptor protein MecA [Clostridia bacterium]
MKIEKVNDHQIRCTLTKSDLADRELKISELAYGTDKAKNLFRDMMQQAAFEFGFEAEDIPLMIEAIPLSADCIVLIITKVEDPEELDTRFSKFAPSVHEDDVDDMMQTLNEDAENVLDLFKRMSQDKSAPDTEATEDLQSEPAEQEIIDQEKNLVRVFSFYDLDSVSRSAMVLKKYYEGENSLFQDKRSGHFFLVISQSEHTPEEFNKICNVITEYGVAERTTAALEAYLEEHMELILECSALQILASVESGKKKVK